MRVTISTGDKREIVDVTDTVASMIDSGSGIVNIFVKHTTAAVACADLDPGTDQDFLEAIKSITPDIKWNHPHDPRHFPDHLWASIIGSSLNVPLSNGELQLGTWQRIVLFEFDGPREREVELTLLKEATVD